MNEIPHRLNFRIDPDLWRGTYSDIARVTHNPFGFTIDFGVLGEPQPAGDGANVELDVEVVARLKIPPGVIFQIARAIADNVSTYEQAFGAITPPPDSGVQLLLGEQEEDDDDDDDDTGDHPS